MQSKGCLKSDIRRVFVTVKSAGLSLRKLGRSNQLRAIKRMFAKQDGTHVCQSQVSWILYGGARAKQSVGTIERLIKKYEADV